MGFFDKLKSNIQEEKIEPKVEEPKVEEPVKKIVKAAPVKKVRKRVAKVEAEAPKSEPEPEPLPPEEPEEEEKPVAAPKPKKKEEPDFEGELAIDVYETDGCFVIQSTIAGVKASDLDITIENDIVTVRGSRERQSSEQDKKYYYQECYWGAFSRQVILPEEVDGSKAEAVIKDGVLTLKIPKIEKVQKRKISIKQEE